MRMAIVEIIGHLIRELACSEDLTSDAHQTQKQLHRPYDLLLERALDLSSHVRPKVFNILSRLCDLPVKFLKQRLAITRAATTALEDKVVGVRKNATSLIVKLIVTHPYGLMHGGLLGMQEWGERYREVVQELQKTEKALDNTLAGADADAEGADKGEEGEQQASDGGESSSASRSKKKQPWRRGNDTEEDAMDVDEEDEEEDEADSIMDEDDDEDAEAETSRAKEGEEASGEGVSSSSPKEKKKGGRKSELDMVALTDEQASLTALESNHPAMSIAFPPSQA